MGMYIDSKTAYLLYQNETKKPYFVDKSMLLKELFPLIEEGGEYICITRPRWFGKTVMANMISAFFNRSYDSADIFENLQIAEDKNYALKFKGRLGERTGYSGRILAVGISYDRKKKEHSCKIEELL